MNNDSILNSIKAQLGICADDTSFDTELIVHINSVLAHVTQLGVGPKEGVSIVDDSATWEQLILDSMTLQNVKSLVYLRVKILFDPSASATVMKAHQEMAQEMEWRLLVQAEHDNEAPNEGDKDITKHSDYLYSLNVSKLNYAFGKKFIEERFKPTFGMCSSVHNGDFYGRNLDWDYNHDAELVIRIPRTATHYASLSVTGANSLFTQEIIKNKKYLEYLDALPFMVVDGINEKGVCVNVNIVHMEKGRTIGTVPLIQKKDSISTVMLPRYILDNYRTAREAVESIRDYISVYAPKTLWDQNMEPHFMICDKNESYVLEFVNNQVVIIKSNYLTNFYLHGVEFNEDGKVYTPEIQDSDHNAVDTNHVTPLGMGLERWNLIVDYYESLNSECGMAILMTGILDYNNSYLLTENKWYTEFTGPHSTGLLTTKSSVQDYEPIMSKARELFDNRSRDDVGDNATWHTAHTSIYNIPSLMLTIYDSSEDKRPHTFML